jgi:syntaxin-binding protein 1
MVMGVDPEGKAIKDIWKQMTPLLGRDNLSSEDRIRLIMIYLLTQPTLNEADRNSMLDHAKLSQTDLESLRRLMLLCGVKGYTFSILFNIIALGYKCDGSKN